ncbi:MAG: DNA-binding response regulator [Spirochaetaceae bacterium]|nr:MAG: DNA-binding response regulator [Spirochaetaceae bacterium]
MAITVVIADDMSEVRSELRRILTTDPTLEVVGEASSGTEAISLVRNLAPDVVLLDVEMEQRDAGIAAARTIHALAPEVRIIVLTVHSDENTVLAAFQAGIVDFITKEQASLTLVEAVKLAMRDRSPLRPLVARHVRNELEHLHQREEQLLGTIRLIATLTATELAILRDIVDGKSRKQIARERFVEIVTIKKHVNGIHKKFNNRNTAAIVREMKELGIFSVIDDMFGVR